MYTDQQDAQISVIKPVLPIATQRPDVSEYTKCNVQLIKVAPDDGLISPKHVEHLMKKWSSITEI